MAAGDRIYKVTDREMTWARAIVIGFVIWIAIILLLGHLPSWIIYKMSTDVTALTELSARLPMVGTICAALGSGQAASDGCNTTQIGIVRDILANTLQMGALAVMLIGAYIWQERKRKRTGGKSVQDVVKGYMPGK